MFNIKIYEKDGTTFKQTLKVEKLERFGNFTSQVNGGFGFLKIGLAYKINDTSIDIANIVKVQYKNQIIFTGSVLDVSKNYGKNSETIELNIMGLASLLTTIQTNATYTDTASNIIKDLVSNFNTEYGYNIFDASAIPATVGNISVDFSRYKNYLQAMQEVAEISGLYFFIGLDEVVKFDEKANFTKHRLTVAKDVDDLQIVEDSKEMVNSLTLKYSTGTKVYTDAPSIALYGKREKYLDKSSDITDVTTSDEFGANYLVQFSGKIKKVSIQVNNEYNFFDINGGDLITVKNVLYDLKDLQVAKVSYGLEKCKIDLERSYSFAKEIFNG